ncbi:conserved hypothetical protein [Desulfovibrionales bacterium]
MEMHEIDLSQVVFIGSETPAMVDLRDLSDDDKQHLLMVGVDAEEHDCSGLFLHTDHSNVHCASHQKGMEVIDIKQALNKYDGLPEYYWKLISPEKDDYTRLVGSHLQGGYFIRTDKGVKVEKSMQSCLFIKNHNVGQSIHNIVVVEEDSELNIITGCAIAHRVKQAIHIGVSEFYVKKNAKLTFTMIHGWGEETMVRTRSVGTIEEGGIFISNYVLLSPVKDLQMYPSLALNGPGAVGRFNSVIVAHDGSYIDTGNCILLNAPETRGEIIARTLTVGGTIISRGHIAGHSVPCRGHLECKGLILGNGGLIYTIPELEGTLPGVELSHEAMVGKIAQEEIEYLMARGLDEGEATSVIVRGFLNVDTMSLPQELEAVIDKIISEFDNSIF